MTEVHREFHLYDLPDDQVFGAFNPDFALVFFQKLCNTLTIEEIAAIAEVLPATIKKWISKCKDSQNPPFIRLDKFQRLMFILEQSENWFVPISKLEKQVIGLKGYGRSGILWIPKIPFREDNNLVRILVHMIGESFSLN